MSDLNWSRVETVIFIDDITPINILEQDPHGIVDVRSGKVNTYMRIPTPAIDASGCHRKFISLVPSSGNKPTPFIHYIRLRCHSKVPIAWNKNVSLSSMRQIIRAKEPPSPA